MAKEDKFEYMASGFYGLNELIGLATPKKCIDWARTRDVKDIEEFIIGYKFFLETVLRSLVDRITDSPIINLTEDYTYYRARHRGILLSKIPNSCEKIILKKNFYDLIKAIRRAKSMESLEEAYSDIYSKIYRPISSLMGKESNLNNNKFSKNEIRKVSMAYWTLIYFNQIQHSLPQGYYVSVYPDSLNPDIWKRSLFGYALTLEFIWSKILGEDYKKYGLNKMHKSTKWKREFVFGDMDEEDKALNLDSFFRIINDKIINPLEKKYDFNFPSSDILYFNGEIDKSYFNDVLTSPKGPNLSFEEEFEHLTFWYNFEVLGSRSEIFSGVPTFLNLLEGVVERKLRLGAEEKSHVIRFAHPDKQVNGNDYSYGVLVQSYGTIGSDWSGWIILYDCCGDYSGFSGQQYAHAESLIKNYEELGLLEVSEMKIPKDKFQKYLSKRLARRDITSERFTLMDTLNELGDSRGKLFELFSYYYLSKLKTYSKVDWQIPTSKGDIDLIAENEDTKKIFECKLNPFNHNIQEEVKKIQEKAKEVGASEIEFWFWYEPFPTQKEYLTKEKIEYRVLSSEIANDANFNKNLDDIKRILGSTDYSEENPIDFDRLRKSYIKSKD
jgi:hypothetical protein